MEMRVKSGRVAFNENVLYGRCVVYDEWSELLFDHFRERIAPGAFDGGIDRDIYCSFDHDKERLLGRTSAGTLELRRVKEGIDVVCPIPPYSWASDLVASVKRGDLSGMSFTFDVTDDAWEMREGTPHRTVLKAQLYEVSFVYFPAYPQTDVGVRGGFPDCESRVVGRAKGLILLESRLRRQKLTEVLLCR